MEGSQHTLETLPPEQSGEALRLVPPPDLCRLVLTSSSMRTLASDPRLWSGIKVKKTKIKQKGLAKLFAIKRFSKIRKINLSRMTFTAKRLLANLNAIVTSSVEDLNLRGVDISQVPAQKLAQVAGCLHKINFESTQLTNEKCIAVLEACVTSTTLKDLDLEGNNLQEVPAAPLAQAAKHLQMMNLWNTCLTTEQSQAVLKACVTSTTLEDLSLGFNNLQEVPAALLAQAAKHLQIINLNGTRLTTEQCIAILETCVASTTLKDLDLGRNDLQEVPATLLAQAAQHVQIMTLQDTRLTTGKCIALLKACATSTTLKDLSLSGNNLQRVPNAVLTQAANHRHLQIMNLRNTRLTTEKCIAVPEACTTSIILKDLYLGYNDHQQVQDALLAKAVKHLLKINLDFTQLTTEQCQAVLEACVASTTLKELSLRLSRIHSRK